MPQRGRSKRAAARQAQLGQRKKKHTRTPSEALAPGSAPDVKEPENGAEPLVEKRPEAPRAPAAVTPRPPLPTRQAQPRPAVYSYAGPELKRIMVVSAGALAILIGLTFVLR